MADRTPPRKRKAASVLWRSPSSRASPKASALREALEVAPTQDTEEEQLDGLEAAALGLFRAGVEVPRVLRTVTPKKRKRFPVQRRQAAAWGFGGAVGGTFGIPVAKAKESAAGASRVVRKLTPQNPGPKKTLDVFSPWFLAPGGAPKLARFAHTVELKGQAPTEASLGGGAEEKPQEKPETTVGVDEEEPAWALRFLETLDPTATRRDAVQAVQAYNMGKKQLPRITASLKRRFEEALVEQAEREKHALEARTAFSFATAAPRPSRPAEPRPPPPKTFSFGSPPNAVSARFSFSAAGGAMRAARAAGAASDKNEVPQKNLSATKTAVPAVPAMHSAGSTPSKTASGVSGVAGDTGLPNGENAPLKWREGDGPKGVKSVGDADQPRPGEDADEKDAEAKILGKLQEALGRERSSQANFETALLETLHPKV